MVNNWQGWLTCIQVWRNVVETFIKKENLGGWYLTSEPSYSVSWNLSEIKDNILSIYIKKYGYNGLSKAKVIYANLYADTTAAQANGTVMALNSSTKETSLIQMNGVEKDSNNSYTLNYYKKFLSVFNPAVWSYDYFAFVPAKVNGVPDPLKPELRNTFFRDIKWIKSMSDFSKKPFWAYVKTEYYKNSGFQYARPTLGSLRFGAFCPLAFGAKGILFSDTFKTVKRSELNPTTEEGKLYKPAAPVLYVTNEDGTGGRLEKTDIYDMVKTVNEEISQISPTLIKSTFVEGGAYPDKLNNQDSGIEAITLKNFTYLDEIEFYDEEGNTIENPVGVILTRFKDERGKEVYVIINQDYNNTQEIYIKFSKHMRCLQSAVFGIKYFDSEIYPGQCLVFTEPEEEES